MTAIASHSAKLAPVPALRLLLTSGIAVALQALATLVVYAWISRTHDLILVGQFGLYLAIATLCQGLDGLRAPLVVSAIRHGVSSLEVRTLARISLLAAGIGAFFVLVTSLALGPLRGGALPLSILAAGIFACSPGLAVVEARHGAHWSTLLQAGGWTIAMLAAGFAVIRAGSITLLGWALLSAPLCWAIGITIARAWVVPSLTTCSHSSALARHGMRLNVATALGGFVDKGMLARFGGVATLGLYGPLAEVTTRAGALGGLVATLFLRDETTHAQRRSGDAQTAMGPHGGTFSRLLALSCMAIVVGAFAAGPVLSIYLGTASLAQIAGFRVLLAALALNLGAQWAAVRLRANGEFDFHRPYYISLVLGIACAPWLVSQHGVIGAATLMFILRSADVALLARARRWLPASDLKWVAATTSLTLLLSIWTYLKP